MGGGGGGAAELAALLARVDGALRAALPGAEWVTGEVSEPTVTAGWARCTLLQPAGEDLAVMQAYIAPEHLRRIRREVAPHRLEALLAPGRTVTAAGRVRRSSRSGRVELRVERLGLTTGEGLLARRRREAEARLRAEGLLDRQRAERRLPLAPLRVGLVSGWDSDGLEDARRVLADSGYQVACKTYQERLEGPGAATRIARALGLAATGGNQAVLLVRGGPGTALSPFDAEPVARAIAGAEVPVLTGIGHQRHHTLADAAAHRACITPTGAAERLVRRLRQAESQLDAAAAQALAAATSARRRRQSRWQRVRLAALAAAALALASLRLGSWPLLVAAAAAAAAALPAAGRTSDRDPRLGRKTGPSGRRPGRSGTGHVGRETGTALPASVEDVIAELEALAAALATGALAPVAAATARVHDLHTHGRQLLRGRHPPQLTRAAPRERR